jgi:hypothetical protein
MKKSLLFVCVALSMSLSSYFAEGQDKSACEKLVEKMEAEAKLNQGKIKELEGYLKKANQKSQKDSLELQKTKELLKKEQEDQRKEQIKQQKEQIKQLQKDSTAMSKNINTVVAERDRLKNAETEKGRIKAGYDSIVAVLSSVRSRWANDTVELARLKTVEIERDNLRTSRDSAVSSLSQVRSQWVSDTAEMRRANEKARNIQSSYDSVEKKLAEKEFELVVKAAAGILDKAYNKPEVDKSVAGLDRIPASSPFYGEAQSVKSLLQKYSVKWNRFREIVDKVKWVDENSKETSMTMQAQHLKDIFSWVKNSSFNAFDDFRDYPFLLKKLQTLTVMKIEDVHSDISKIFEQ